MRLDFLAHGVGVVTFIVLDDSSPFDLFEQGVGRGAIGNLAASQHEGNWRQSMSVRAWILVVRPPRERPVAWRCSPPFR
jgi:hypothetical protein